jgi:chromosome segregation ATPase
MKSTYLNEWLERNTREIEIELQLSTLNTDNNRLREIFNAGIHLQNDLKFLQESLETIDLIIKEFEQATENNESERPTNLSQQFEQLSKIYIDFLKHCKQISDQCEYYTNLFNEINHLNVEFVQSINEFNQHLSSNEKHPNVIQLLSLSNNSHLLFI